MASGFSQLAHEICEVAGISPPSLEPDREGVLALSISLRGVPISLSHDPTHFPAHLFIQVGFGRAPEDRERAMYSELLDANAFMLQPGGPSFARHPLDGEILLQCTWPLAGASGARLWQAMAAATDAAELWRATGTLAALTPRLSAPVDFA